jgi:membrane fusion protein (multidrug efflux system)
VSLADAHAAQAAAALHLAELALSYTTVRAPRAGVVSRRSVEDGQVVSPERPLLAIVPRDDVWIVANFKEDQLADMRPGQVADIRFDTFGRRDFTGHVESVAGATGARFALLPPDNATGNYVKVVQRVPVLIRLDAAASVELRPGMSADITVHTERGK